MKTILLFVILAAGLFLASSCGREPQPSASPSEETAEPKTPISQHLYSFELADIDGNPVSLSRFRGKVLLLVNVASKCGFTKQYEGLEALYEKYRDRGLEVLAFPANNFGGQEPGTNAQIKEFCMTTYGVAFPLFAKISVRGDDIHPLYRFLTGLPQFGGDIPWNFTKFLVNRQGEVIGRYDPAVAPLDERLVGDIQAALGRSE
ncbi:MAG TPA: redoxin domain-containing protein [Sedimentisphaerales bacterium]|nr:redoxin domain-containing protein [Sedimentisphaerales bacterium]HQG47793.1 redoxin domain-containing protein [Sedimentisphaerales bacterium]HQI28484.1 redoxin domain-containing protein [Sedimentisphaerales bacterium]